MIPKKERCKEKVVRYARNYPPAGAARCSRRAVKDGYCRQHHPNTVAKRREEAERRWKAKEDRHPLTLMFKEQARANAAEGQLAQARAAILAYIENGCVLTEQIEAEMRAVLAKPYPPKPEAK